MNVPAFHPPQESGGSLRVCLVTHVFPRHPGDSVAPFLNGFVKALHRQGVVVEVVCPHAAGLPGLEERQEATIHRFRYGPASLETLAYHGDMHERARTLSGLLRLPAFLVGFLGGALAHARRADLIHAHWWIPGGIVGALAARILHKPLVITLHGTDAYMLGKSPRLVPVARWVLGRAARVIANSQRTAEEVVKRRLVAPEKIAIGAVGVDADLFFPVAEPLAETPAETPAPRLLYAGRLAAIKGVEYLIRAVPPIRREFPDVRLHVVGDGPERGRLEVLIAELDLQESVQILSGVSQQCLADHYRWSDVVVVPSIVEPGGRQEGLGAVILEAMACARPVVGTRTGGIPEAVCDGVTGLLVPERDPGALAEALLSLLKDPARRRQMGQAAVARCAEEFTLDALGRRTVEVYRCALERKM